MFEDFKLQRVDSLRRQVGDYLREEIRRGKLPGGSKLPSTQALAEHWGTHAANIHAAIRPLVKEGLLLRKPGVGTVVNTMVNTRLETIAIYMLADTWHPGNIFSRLVVGFIEQELNRRNIECLVINENRVGAGYEQVKRLADTRRLQGMIAPGVRDRAQLRDFFRLPVPFSVIGAGHFNNRLSYNLPEFAAQIVTAVQRQQCRSVGILCSIPAYPHPKNSSEREEHSFYELLFKLLADASIETRPEWTVTVQYDNQCTPDTYGTFAYKGFRQIWASAQRPEALFVGTDDLIAGTLLAMLKSKVTAPDDIKLVLNRNSELSILCPLPCVMVETSIAQMATSLVELVIDQFHGRPVTPAGMHYTLQEYPEGNIDF